MGWFSSSATEAQPYTGSQQPAPPNNLASDLKTPSDSKTAEKVKPCCVCKDEKAARDQCMLFSDADDPQEACKNIVDSYKSCMRGYGFKVQ